MRVQKKLIVIAGALSGLLLIGCGEQEINLEDYLTVTYSWANGYATAEVEFDYTAFGDAIVENGNDKEMSLMEVLAAADNVKISSDVKDNLSMMILLVSNLSGILMLQRNWDLNI